MGYCIPGLSWKYPMHEYVSVVLIVVFLIIFMLADAQMPSIFNVLGVMMVYGALLMDSFIGIL